MRTFEDLLSAVAEFGLAILELDGVVNVIRHAAEGLPVHGHAVAQPQEIAAVNSENSQHENDQATLHCSAAYRCLSGEATLLAGRVENCGHHAHDRSQAVVTRVPGTLLTGARLPRNL